MPQGCIAVETSVPGSLWKVTVAEGDVVAAGDTVAIVESMKMEMAVTAPRAGKVAQIRAVPGQGLSMGEIIAVLEIEDAT